MGKKKTNNEAEIIDVYGYTPHPGQIKLNDLVINHNYKYYTFSIGRQYGKSKWALNMMLYWAINEKNSNIYYVSPTFKLARLMFIEMLDAIGESGILKSINKTSLIFEFKDSGSKISFHSGERIDSLRGASLTHLVIDEMAYTKRDLWEVVLQPATLVKGKKVCFISTPAGRNHFFELFQRGKSTLVKDKKYCSYTAPSTDNPYIDKEELEESQKNDLWFRQEYLAEFLEDSLSVFKNIRECTYNNDVGSNTPEKGKNYYMGVDLANKDDYTVGIIMDQDKKVVDIMRIRYLDSWKMIVDYLTELYQKWNPVHGYIEINFNPSVYEDLKANGCKNLHPFVTGYNKTQIINDLIFEFGNKTISIPENEPMADELKAFTYRFNKSTGKIHYSAPRACHDDIVMALAFCLQSVKTKKGKGSKFSWSWV